MRCRFFTPDMPRYLFTCAYDGQPWLGWQSQAGGGTVQDCIESAFARILKGSLRIHAAGRTDSGVHALAQCFHADVPAACHLNEETWRAALNAQLPASVRIMDVRVVSPDFHARFSATAKEYEYRICVGVVLPPHLAGRVWHCRHALHVSVLRRTLKLFEGEHDFRNFSARRGNEPTSPPPDFFCRTIYSATLTQSGEILVMRFCGSGFLYRMVRMLVGTAVRVACGSLQMADIRHMLKYPSGTAPRYCAPAEGLYLTRVIYDHVS